MGERTTGNQRSEEEQLAAAVKFIEQAGGIEKAKKALDELKKLRKTG